MEISTHLLLNRRQASVANLNKNIDADDLLVSGDLSTPGNPNTKHEKEDFVLSQVGVDVIAPSVAEDAEAHTSMEMKGGSESCVATLEKMELRLGSEDGLMQDDTELTKVGGSSADEHVIDLNDKARSIEIVDESLKRAWIELHLIMLIVGKIDCNRLNTGSITVKSGSIS
ncbi:hypothetical protein Tco_1530340 [Tanacetum coccineum]